MADVMQVRAVSRVVDELGVRVGEAKVAFGDVPAVQRLANDVERLRIDVLELDGLSPRLPSPESGPKVTIDDSPVDASLWVDADDEGIGGFHGTHR